MSREPPIKADCGSDLKMKLFFSLTLSQLLKVVIQAYYRKIRKFKKV